MLYQFFGAPTRNPLVKRTLLVTRSAPHVGQTTQLHWSMFESKGDIRESLLLVLAQVGSRVRGFGLKVTRSSYTGQCLKNLLPSTSR